MEHLIKIKNLDMNLEATIPEWVVFDDEKADLIYEWTDQNRFLFFELKGCHEKLWHTRAGNYVLESCYEGNKPWYEVISKADAADLVRERDRETYIKHFKPRVL